MTFTNLPVQLTSFIGRERELAEVERLVSTSRLVTITGPGGVGKTSLALHVADAVRDTFADGVLFISLAAITDSTLIIPTIVHSIGLAESPNKLLLDSLKEFLRDRQVLVLLDNFEQVIAAAPLLTELLSACARLKLLVTSRETLHLQGEHEFPLAPLELSNIALIPSQLSVETLLEYPGIALFVERAQANQPDFKLTADNASAVDEVCARLDGLPLAIELAAARIKLLPPKTILARLQESSLNLLTGGARDAPARQQTLRNTIQWSYDLLNTDEQFTFRWLSTFVGGCTLNAATMVIGQQLSTIHDKERKVDHWSMITLDLITSLVNKSLVRQAESDGEPRLGMLETIREFGQEQLAHTNELESAQRALADHYLSLAEEGEQHLTGREQRTWLNRLGREQDNLRAALRWGFEYHATECALRLVGALWQYWFLRGQWTEGRRWLEEALSVTSNVDVPVALRAKVVYAAAAISRHQYDIARARALCEQSITLYRALGDKEGLLAGLLQLCRILHFQGDDELLRARLPEMLALAEELPDVTIKAQVFAELPVIAQDTINSGMAARYLAESERIYRLLDNPAGLAFTLLLQGQIAAFQGDVTRAQALWSEGERSAAEVDDHNLKLRILLGHLSFAWLTGDDDFARRQYEQFFIAVREMNDTTRLSVSLVFMPAILHRQGLSVWAARVYGLADQLDKTSESLRLGGELFDPLMKRAAVAQSEVRAQLGDEAFARAMTEGRSMTVEDLLNIPHPPASSISRAQAASDSIPYEALTPRELEVLHLLAQNLSNPHIAERLVVSRRTVDAHLRAIYEKLGVKSRDAALRVAIEHGLIQK